MPFFRQFQHLLPDALAWRITVTKTLRQFFEGLTNAPSDARDYVDLVYDDVFPATTRELTQWEKQFGIQPNLVDAVRRANIAAEWAATGGQSPSYIQGILQTAGFPVFVHDWWELPFSSFAVSGIAAGAAGSRFTTATPHGMIKTTLVRHTGFASGAYNGSFSAAVISTTEYDVAELPFIGTETGTVQPYLHTVIDPRIHTTVPLIGNIQCTPFALIPDQPQCTGAGVANQPVCDNKLANQPGYLVNDTLNQLPPPLIPDDPALWPYFVYVGGETFPDTVFVDIDRQQEFERLLLKLCPAHVWIVMRVDFVQDDDFFFGPGTKGWGESAWRQ